MTDMAKKKTEEESPEQREPSPAEQLVVVTAERDAAVAERDGLRAVVEQLRELATAQGRSQYLEILG